VPQRAFCFSQRYAQRLRDEGLRGEVTMLGGAYEGSLQAREPIAPEPLVVFAGRHIPEKEVPAIPPAIAAARRRLPQLRAMIFGDGPERQLVRSRVAQLGLEDVVQVPGFVETARVDEAIGRALCLLHPSRREGYGLVVVEAAAHGTPTVVVEGDDNAAVELIEPGVNGVVAASTSPEDLAAAIEAIADGGEALRATTRGWFADNAQRVSLARSLSTALAVYDSARR
jgi:glycosyltransferase involved in cell wall biosynthesis